MASRHLMALHKEGYAIPVSILVQHVSSTAYDSVFMGVLTVRPLRVLDRGSEPMLPAAQGVGL
jgi:hypothetical protein